MKKVLAIIGLCLTVGGCQLPVVQVVSVKESTLRETPSACAREVARIPFGTEVEVLGYVNTKIYGDKVFTPWGKVSCNGREGYLPAQSILMMSHWTKQKRSVNYLAMAGTNNKWAHLWWGIYHKDFVTRTNHSLDLAEKSFKEAIRLDDQFDLAWVNLGRIEQARKNYPAAKRRYREALERTPRMKEALMEMGFIYGLTDHYRTAIAYLDDAVEEDPSYRTAYERRALTYESLGVTEKSAPLLAASERDWTSAVHLSPNNPYAYMRRARLYRRWADLDVSRLDDARKDIAAAVDVYCDGMDLPGTGDITTRMKTAIKHVDNLPLDRLTREQLILTGGEILKELEALALK